ncbi:MAG: alkaline phosphatase family protein [Candidatus Aminicenantales bacterium]
MKAPLRKREKIYILFFLLAFALPLGAYIGPGAGFAFLSSFLVLFITFLLALFSLVSWPFRFLLRMIRGQKAFRRSRIQRLIIIGLDGLEPSLAEKFMREGKLPYLSEIKEKGSYTHLRTTTPAISPVAWSSFMTGTNPSKHNIFDFLNRDPKTYLPYLSSARIGKPRKFFYLGKYRIPLSRPEIRGLRKSVPFWKVLSDNGIFSTVIRVPITFPPEKYHGHLLSGMCVPDLKGSQGTFFFYTTDREKLEKRQECITIPVTLEGNTIRTEIPGPENSLLRHTQEELKLPLTITLDDEHEKVKIELPGKKFILKKGVLSEWINLTFRPGLGMKVRALCRFCILSLSPHFEMYISPLNIDPEKPALPLSHPFIYSIYLAKLLGPFVTLGEANDTWALNEEVLSEETFLDFAYACHQEWEKMLFNALDKVKRGLITCVFETPDSVQHMFWRYVDKSHPALNARPAEMGDYVLMELYVRMDKLVGRVLETMNKNDMLLVISDHGFKSFRRGVNLNSWLFLNGYLYLEKGKEESGEWFEDVDWERTKAYALGLGGLYLNLRGREISGIVEPGEEAKKLKAEIKAKLEALRDEDSDQPAICHVYDRDELPSGPYSANSPDLIIGYNDGYRASWDSVTGKVDKIIFKDNTKAWSGDHCLDPPLVPGVFFSTRKIDADFPSIVDIAPTVLELFGLEIPSYMDGKSLLDLEEKTEERRIK